MRRWREDGPEYITGSQIFTGRDFRARGDGGVVFWQQAGFVAHVWHKGDTGRKTRSFGPSGLVAAVRWVDKRLKTPSNLKSFIKKKKLKEKDE
jgi:hypothetical protein